MLGNWINIYSLCYNAVVLKNIRTRIILEADFSQAQAYWIFWELLFLKTIWIMGEVWVVGVIAFTVSWWKQNLIWNLYTFWYFGNPDTLII